MPADRVRAATGRRRAGWGGTAALGLIVVTLAGCAALDRPVDRRAEGVGPGAGVGVGLGVGAGVGVGVGVGEGSGPGGAGTGGAGAAGTTGACRVARAARFEPIGLFPACAQPGQSCAGASANAAEIVAASADGRTLVYTDGPGRALGFIDITEPAEPRPLGVVAVSGEPTSVAVRDDLALAVVDTSSSARLPSGELVVVDIASRVVVARQPLSGQPDSIAVSPDHRFAAIVIENQRDDAIDDGAMPQLPGGYLVVLSIAGEPVGWTRRSVDLAGLAGRFRDDPEPEYVDINRDNIAVVSLQENNALVLVDVAKAAVVAAFPAGDVERPGLDPGEPARRVPREPDGVGWLSTERFVTANEGAIDGGSRGFTIFDRDGRVVVDAGDSLEEAIVAAGLAPAGRARPRGSQPEGIEVGRFGESDHLFVAAERAGVVAVYRLAPDPTSRSMPVLSQLLATGAAPEGVLALPARGLLAVANEKDDAVTGQRAGVRLYRFIADC